MRKTVVVDGSNLLFQMFYGMPARILGPQGQPIQGTVGFVGALLKILRCLRPTHVAVVFDGECQNPRKALDESYKSNRPDYSQIPPEDTPFSQLPDIFSALALLDIPWAETECCEADDWLAGYAFQCAPEDQLILVSQDSDLFQLIRPNVHIFRYRGDRSTTCDEGYLRDRFGISPDQYADFKSLTGDNADNIKGAPGIGPKTAAALLQQFGSLEALLSQTHRVTRPAIRASLEKSAGLLRKNRQLILLDGQVPLPFSPEQMRWQDAGLTSTQVLRRLRLR